MRRLRATEIDDMPEWWVFSPDWELQGRSVTIIVSNWRPVWWKQQIPPGFWSETLPDDITAIAYARLMFLESGRQVFGECIAVTIRNSFGLVIGKDGAAPLSRYGPLPAEWERSRWRERKRAQP